MRDLLENTLVECQSRTETLSRQNTGSSGDPPGKQGKGKAVVGQDKQGTFHLLTVREVATYLGVTQRTVYRLMKEYDLPACKVGAQWRFKSESIEAWMQSRVDHSLDRTTG